MKSYEFIREADKQPRKPQTKTQTKTQTRPDLNLGSDLSGPTYHPIEPVREPSQQSQQEPKQEPKSSTPQRKVASQQSTLKATRGIGNSEMARLLGRMRDIEADSNDPGYPKQEPTQSQELVQRVDTNNLPTVAGSMLQAAGIQNPEWHQVANLPGNMRQGIRTLGRRLFASFTRTPTDNIHVVANLGGQGPNTTKEVNAVAKWLLDTGDDLGNGNIDFDQIMPGYSADIKQFVAGGIRWLLVKDQFGQYIYSWPESDSVDSQKSLPQQSRKALGR